MKIGNYTEGIIQGNKWVNYQGIVVPVAYLPKPRDSRVAIYFSFKDIYKEENGEELLLKEVAAYNRIDFLQTLSKINYFLSDHYNSPDKFEWLFARDIFTKEVKDKILSGSKERQKIFIHQQILALIKICLMAKNSKSKKLANEELNAFGKTLMRVNDYLEKDTLEISEKIDEVREKALWRKTMATHLARNLLFNSYNSFPDHMIIYWLLYFKYAVEVQEQYYPLAKKFEEITGIDIELYYSLIYVIWLHYSHMLKKEGLTDPRKFLLGAKFFAAMKDDAKNNVVNLFRLLSGTDDFYKEELKAQTKKINNFYFTFGAIWKKPFYRVNKETYFPMDMYCVEERVTSGLYWTISDYLMDKGLNGEKDKFHGYYGRIFENLVADSLKRNYGKGIKRLFLETDKDQTGGVDAIIFYPDSLFFVEFTTTSIRRDTLISANVKVFEEEIKMVLLGSENRKSKGRAVKLHSAIKSFKKARLKLDNISVKNIKNFYPVIVFQNSPPQIAGIWDMYLEAILDAKDEEGEKILENEWRNLQFIDIGELFVLEQLVKDGFDLSKLFAEKIKSTYINDSWKNYLIYKKLWRRNTYLKEQFDVLSDMAAMKLFGKKLKKKKHPL